MRRALGVLAIAATVAFGLLAAHVASGAATAFDVAVGESFHAAVAPLWRSLFQRFDWFGRGDVLTAASTIVIAVLLFRRQRLLALLWWLTQGGGATLLYLLKFTFDRARPRYADPALIEGSSLSFPSGHTMMTLVFVGFGLYLFLRKPRSTPARVTATAMAMIWCTLMGFSRLYLENHYLSDVLGGYLAGIAWLAVCILISDAAIRKSMVAETLFASSIASPARDAAAGGRSGGPARIRAADGSIGAPGR